jgi:hypothetical protein
MTFAEAVIKMIEGYKCRADYWPKYNYMEYINGKFVSTLNDAEDNMYVNINYPYWEIFKQPKVRCIDCIHIDEIGISIRNITKNKRTITSHCEKTRTTYFETFKKRYCDKFEKSKYKINLH